MKKINALLIVAVFALQASGAYAAVTNFGPVSTKAEVPAGLTLTVVLHKNNSVGAVVTSMDFGTLLDIGTGTLRSTPTGSTGTGNVTAMITGNAQGVQYTIKQTGSLLSNGSTTLPSGACTVVPVYTADDNGGAALPGGASTGTAGSWIATDKVLYTSEAAGALRTIQAIYSITDDNTAGSTEGVPVTQPGGIYNGIVTFTMTS